MNISRFSPKYLPSILAKPSTSALMGQSKIRTGGNNLHMVPSYIFSHNQYRYTNSNTLPNHYALLVGGENSDEPEYASYFGIERLYNSMNVTGRFQNNSISILFGNGKNKYARNLDKKLMEIKQLPNLKGSFNRENISQEIESFSKSIKNGDRLWIYLEGHGIKYKGVRFSNEYYVKNFISPDYLKQQINKLPTGVNITLIVDSCYSGEFLSLTSKNITVLTTTNRTTISTYSRIEGTNEEATYSIDALAIFFSNYSSNNVGRTPLFYSSLGSFYQKNLNSTDSLSHYLDNYLDNYLKKDTFKNKIKNIYNNRLISLLKKLPNLPPSDVIFIYFLGLLTSSNISKTSSLCGSAIDLAMITFLLANFLPKVNIEEVPLFSDEKKLNILKSLKNEKKGISNPDLFKLSPEEKKIFMHIVYFLKEFKESFGSEEVKIHYFYLYEKFVFFIQRANIEEIRFMISIATNLLNPLDLKLKLIKDTPSS